MTKEESTVESGGLMERLYRPNGRVKLMLFNRSALDSMPSRGVLKKEFQAKDVTFYKSWGLYSDVIRDLITLPQKAKENPLGDEIYDVTNGIYACFDASAKLNVISVLRYSHQVSRYIDVTCEGLKQARGLDHALWNALRRHEEITSFCRSMDSLKKLVSENELLDDVLSFNQETFLQAHGTYGLNFCKLIRQRLETCCDRLVWNPDSPQSSKTSADSINDGILELKAA